MHSTSVSLVPFTTHQSSSTDVTALFPPVTFTTYWCRSWSLEWLAQSVVPDRRKGAKTNKIDNVYLSIIERHAFLEELTVPSIAKIQTDRQTD